MIRQQQWALDAFKKVSAYKGSKDEAGYAAQCMSGPALIRQSGLLQAIAFLKSRKKNNSKTYTYVDDFSVVLSKRDSDEFQKILLTSTTSEYRAWSRNATAVAIWFRRFAQSELSTDDSTVNHAAQ